MNEKGLSLGIGTLVRFAHERNGGPVHRIVALTSNGKVELDDMDGWFAQHLFAVADDIGGIPEVPAKDSRRASWGEAAFTVRVQRLDYLGRTQQFEFDGYALLRELLDDIEGEAERRGWMTENVYED
jgi:hypothetical protein